MNIIKYLRTISYTVPQWLTALLCICGLALAGHAGAAAPVSVFIGSPAKNSTVHDNTGAVPVDLVVHGVTFSAAHRVRVLLDGKPHGTDQRTLQFTVQGVERGEHQLQVQLLDSADSVLATSPTVRFYQWQASRLFPPRKDGPPPR